MLPSNRTDGCLAYIFLMAIGLFVLLQLSSCVSSCTGPSSSPSSLSDKAQELGTSTSEYAEALGRSKKFLDSY